MRRSHFLVGLTALSLTLPLAPAKAEVFLFKDDAQDSIETARQVTHPDQKQRFIGKLEKKDDIDFYVMTLKKGEAITLELDVPSADADFYPSLTVFGPGFAKPTEDIGFSVGDLNGAFSARVDKKNRDERNERFIFTTYLLGPRIDAVAPEDAAYGIAVRAPNGSTGRYALIVGTEDAFSWNQFIQRMVGYIRAIFRNY